MNTTSPAGAIVPLVPPPTGAKKYLPFLQLVRRL